MRNVYLNTKGDKDDKDDAPVYSDYDTDDNGTRFGPALYGACCPGSHCNL